MLDLQCVGVALCGSCCLWELWRVGIAECESTSLWDCQFVEAVSLPINCNLGCDVACFFLFLDCFYFAFYGQNRSG